MQIFDFQKYFTVSPTIYIYKEKGCISENQ